jgi:hypothetical protein
MLCFIKCNQDARLKSTFINHFFGIAAVEGVPSDKECVPIKADFLSLVNCKENSVSFQELRMSVCASA